MSIVQFTKQEFEDALTASAAKFNVLWSYVGYIGSDHHYQFKVSDYVYVQINSSVKRDGRAASAGEDSIRGWLTDNQGNTLGHKTQRWVTRQKNWEANTIAMIGKLVARAKIIRHCNKCGTTEKVWEVKKGKPENIGKLFKACQCDGSFTWLDDLDTDAPDCPKCGKVMKLRTGRNGDFWGCPDYPSCNGTRNVDEEATQKIVMVVGKQAPLPWTNEATQQIIAQEAEQEATQSRHFVKIDKTLIAAARLNTPAKRTFVPSKYNLAIFEWVKTSKPGECLVVEAGPGTGKTTNSLEMLKYVPAHLRVQFVAYNSHIKKELAQRAPRHVKVTTYHGMGFSVLAKHFGLNAEDNVKEDKVKILFKQVLDWDTNERLYPPVKELVDLCRSNLVEATTAELERLADYHGVLLTGSAFEVSEEVEAANKALIFDTVAIIVDLCRTTVESMKMIDFTDMCWLPVVLDLPAPQQDFIVIDEAQDTDPSQLRLIIKAMHKGTRVVAVGDRHQSIYGWRGADAYAIQNIIVALNAKLLPLPISYRLPLSGVKHLNEKFPHIHLEAAPDAKPGEVRNTHSIYDILPQDGDVILCRNNAPLVRVCFALIRRGIKATILGRKIGEGLVGLVKKMKAGDNITELMKKLAEYREREVAKLVAAKKNNQAQLVDDQVETIIAIASFCVTPQQVIDNILAMFSDSSTGVVCSTIHKFKGKEATNIYLWMPWLMPSKYAQQEWELLQEENVEWVARSRQLGRLVTVETDIV